MKELETNWEPICHYKKDKFSKSDDARAKLDGEEDRMEN